MRGTTKTAKHLLPFFEAVALAAGMKTDHVKLSVSVNNRYPEAQFHTVRLPDLSDEPDLYVRSFLHELQHVRDVLDGVNLDLSGEEMEVRARKAESSVSLVVARSLVSTHAHLFPRVYNEHT